MSSLQKYRDEELVYLLSNGSQHMHPQNTAANFTIQLAIPLEFGGEAHQWEVGITELQLPTTFYNVTDGNNSFRLSVPIDAANEHHQAKKRAKEKKEREERERKVLNSARIDSSAAAAATDENEQQQGPPPAKRQRRDTAAAADASASTDVVVPPIELPPGPAKIGSWQQPGEIISVEAGQKFSNLYDFIAYTTAIFNSYSPNLRFVYNPVRRTLVLRDDRYTRLRLSGVDTLVRMGVPVKYRNKWRQLFDANGAWTLTRSVTADPNEPFELINTFVVERQAYLALR